MPQFAPGESKTAIAPIMVKPSGLNCEAEIFLGPDDMTKVVTSGMRPFVSTGVSQDVSFPIVMPTVEGIYHVFIDVYAEGYLIAAYKAIEDVVIAVIEIEATFDAAGGGMVSNWEDHPVTYQTVRNATLGRHATDATGYVGQVKDEYGYMVDRGFVGFRVSIPSRYTILSATLSLDIWRVDRCKVPFNLVLQKGTGAPYIPPRERDFDHRYYSGNGGSISTTQRTPGMCDIELNEDGLSWIGAAPGTINAVFALRSDKDINSIAPTTEEHVGIRFTNAKLAIVYRPEPEPPILPVPCVYCGATYDIEEELIAHMESNHPNKPYLIYAYPTTDVVSPCGSYYIKWKAYIPNLPDMGGRWRLIILQNAYPSIIYGATEAMIQLGSTGGQGLCEGSTRAWAYYNPAPWETPCLPSGTYQLVSSLICWDTDIDAIVNQYWYEANTGQTITVI